MKKLTAATLLAALGLAAITIAISTPAFSGGIGAGTQARTR
jgi:hypothetical protein